jgi:hypothetical protein
LPFTLLRYQIGITLIHIALVAALQQRLILVAQCEFVQKIRVNIIPGLTQQSLFCSEIKTIEFCLGTSLFGPKDDSHVLRDS